MFAKPAEPLCTGAQLTSESRSQVLVAYESRLESTAEVAAFIGEVLSEDGASVDVKTVEQVADLKRYDRVVVGSAIRYDRWLPEAIEFVEANQRCLSRVPVAFFFTCLVLARGTAKAEQKAEAYASGLARLLPGAEPVDIRGFAGVLDTAKAPWPTRLLLRGLSAVTGVAEGDYRDWEAIRYWSRSLFTAPFDPPAPVADAPLRPDPTELLPGRTAGSAPPTA